MFQNDEDRIAHVNELRTKNTEENHGCILHNRGAIDAKVNDLIRLLQDNIGHIGAVGLVLLPTEGDSLVNMNEGTACDGVAAIVGENEPAYVLMNHHWKTSFERQHGAARQKTAMMRGMPTSLADLLGMGRDQEMPSDEDDE